jgi:hypothetical protein
MRIRTGNDFGPATKWVTVRTRLARKLERRDARDPLLEGDRDLDPREVEAGTCMGERRGTRTAPRRWLRRGCRTERTAPQVVSQPFTSSPFEPKRSLTSTRR